ncbi:hypothetical protein SUGI_0569780 [Cryptomeria japonica]|nr:hypothetical protein SUGI_0569780 [Cryptomeria japonica]
MEASIVGEKGGKIFSSIGIELEDGEIESSSSEGDEDFEPDSELILEVTTKGFGKSDSTIVKSNFKPKGVRGEKCWLFLYVENLYFIWRPVIEGALPIFLFSLRLLVFEVGLDQMDILECDAIYRYDEAGQNKVQQDKPWNRDPHYFKKVKGKTDGDTIIVMDAFALPVEGTETRVNAQADAYEYMVEYAQTTKQAGRMENVVGWYHSHPGYGCWLSGIDVSTQMLNQQFQEPFLAVVIDPTRTVSAGKVEIGAFRTYPQGYKPPDEPVSEYQTIPLNKIEDFGVHCKQYYALDITYFKSSLDSHLLDLLWNKYWVNTLSSSPLLGNRDYVAGQISDLAEKLEQAESQLAHSRVGSFLVPPQRKKEEESQLAKITRDSSKITVEQVHGLMSQVIKDTLFNSVHQSARNGLVSTEASGPEPMIET